MKISLYHSTLLSTVHIILKVSELFTLFLYSLYCSHYTVLRLLTLFYHSVYGLYCCDDLCIISYCFVGFVFCDHIIPCSVQYYPAHTSAVQCTVSYHSFNLCLCLSSMTFDGHSHK